MVFGIIFLVLGVLGFIPNPLISMDGLFQVDAVHNIIHLITGLVLVYAGKKSAGGATTALKVFGIIYLVIAILGFLMIGGGSGDLLGFIGMNGVDNWLHLILGLLLAWGGFKGGKGGMSGPSMATPPPSQPTM
ncbi:MAG: hypothetical protein A2653_02735 [Candidatus Zambryskibacteria bacterium RIFCSPHIGHO2_01_FULL_43_25]|uniref:DUF4383 domain-containing protein n=1 Tax=Candidatus Zambryskibacteria bacterium RIFCSPLOWO2_01_FULL_45_21 TaxID=1802761 RepID=A0A1G2U0K8_9BACT|nr:MAG: hypothetical protein A2653_02735 [Candidatus Zambryskibacteria bacterium RIFCSPHIGHO2_01_FULL_43_25]OHB00538.1 MAG: hypothetical protein A3E94_01945 [Candidatus Zambryskibacteria bacterium RIFCSPHIGHO2_12_FULL_44_12b]OHB03048.1 MAG: hypothetical protein A3B14_00070 [Candidatus Zambryskibacteria bacterium RIFCSPLOWO2_01_FULL_45_21]